jgi:hypothetical protein
MEQITDNSQELKNGDNEYEGRVNLRNVFEKSQLCRPTPLELAFFDLCDRED